MPETPSAEDVKSQETLYRKISDSIREANSLLEDQYKLNELNRASLEGQTYDADAVAEALSRAGSSAADLAGSVEEAAGETAKADEHTKNLYQGLETVLGVIGQVAAGVTNMAMGLHDMVFPENFMRQLNVIQENFGTIGRNLDNEADAHASMLVDIAGKLQKLTFDPDITNKISKALGGTSILQVYQGDLEDAMSTVNELILGPTGMLAGMNIIKNMNAEVAIEMDILGKGLSLNSEQIGTFVSRQISLTGKSGPEMLEQVAVYSKIIAAKTGDNQKIISAGVERIISDTENFGNVSIIEAARVTSNLRQMGIGFEDLQGAVSKFQNFESAAQSVAALTTVFGVQLDAMEMMKLSNEDQGEFLLRLRESFIATGRSADNLTRAEKALIKEQLGFTDIESVERLFNADAIMIDGAEALAAVEGTAVDMESALASIGGSVEGIRTPAQVVKDTYNATRGVMMAKFDLVDELKGLGVEAQKTFDIMWNRLSSGAVLSEEELQEFSVGLRTSTEDVKELQAHMKATQEENIAPDIDRSQVETILSSVQDSFATASAKLGPSIIEGIHAVQSLLKDEGVEGGENYIDGWQKADALAASPSGLGLRIVKGIVDAMKTLPDHFRDVFDELNSIAAESSSGIDKSYSELELTPTIIPTISEDNNMDLVGKALSLSSEQVGALVSGQISSTDKNNGGDKNIIASIDELTAEIRQLIEAKVPIRLELDGKEIVNYIISHPLGTNGRLITKQRGL